MIEFAAAWEALAIGDGVTVSKGAAEPQGGPDSVEFKIWRSHNFAGELAEKVEGPPREMRVNIPTGDDGNTVGFVVREGDGHAFAPAVITPLQARNARWEQAKAYKALKQAEPVAIPEEITGLGLIVADAEKDDRDLIEGFARGAMSAIMGGTPEAFSLKFTDHTNEEFTAGAMQTIAIANYMLRQFTLCHAASQAIRRKLDAALEREGVTVEEILAIDIGEGYP